MTAKTRYFVIVSLLVLVVGLGTGLVAYYSGFQMSALMGRGGPQELQYVPRDATVVAYADVRDVMTSQLRQKVHHAVPVPENGQREFETQTGINIETDIDRVVACVNPGHDGADGAGMVLARGRFNDTKIEALMRQHGAHAETYNGKRLIIAEHMDMGPRTQLPDSSHMGGATRGPRASTNDLAVAFLEPGLVAVGTPSIVRNAIDLRNGGASVMTNDEVMTRVRNIDTGNAWAIGQFDALSSKARLPEPMASQLPQITWVSVSSHINGGIRGVIRAETRDEEAANNLRDVARGFMALAKMQTASNVGVQTVMQSLELSGSGKTVTLSFSVPAEVFDALAAIHDGTRSTKPRDQ